MKLFSTLFAFLLCIQLVHAQTIKISEARAKPIGTSVTVKGLVLNGSELGTTIRYLQDSTGAISAFYSSATMPTFSTVKRGDSVEVTGVLKEFNSLLELDPITNFRIINSGNSIPPPLSITPAGMAEINESKLVKLSNGTFTGATTPTFVGNTTYQFNVNGTNVQVRIATGSAMVGKTIPSVSLNLVGLCSQFAANYQLLPRDSSDLEFQGIAITSPVKVTELTSSGFKLTWDTNIEGNTEIQYGTTPALGTSAVVADNLKAHTIGVSNQTASKLLYVRVLSRANGKADSSKIFPVITASVSTGETRVYFNHSVDTTVRVGNNRPLATTGGRCESELVSYITNAKSSIDVAMYNNGSTAVVQALKNAAARGVRVRYITDLQTNNAVLADTTGFGFTVFKKPTADLMHNKFFIIDADSVNTSWVMSGAMNLTTGQIYQDYNNMIFVQDKSLALIYRMEFEEMWGGSGIKPNPTTAKFGSNKTDNTPKQVKLAGKLCEVYFSPTDETSLAIINTLNTADVDLEMSLLILTYFDLGTTINNAQRRGVQVRGLIDQDTVGSSSQINFLQRNGVNIKLFRAGGSSTIYHHKLAIIDAKPAGANSDPTVITGSHNWTNTAETRNDENILIIHDPSVANIYLQEFEARWKEQGVGTKEVKLEGFDAVLFPNPSSDWLNIRIKNDIERDVLVSIFNAEGQAIESVIYRNQMGEVTKNIPLSHLPNGQYFVRFGVEGQFLTKSIQVIR
ncbi:MAG: T9SS type A sorting domain-containing protein [Saprospiraceae bacterium]|nr:T9SS type A sorting domain-containing protein [Saprospiraceae bacterium]